MVDIVSVQKFALQVAEMLQGYTLQAYESLDLKPSRVIELAPGEMVALDDCCDGQLWARLESITPTPASAPSVRPGLTACAQPHYLATVELGIMRCASVVSDRGVAPSAETITSEGQLATADMSVLLGTITCNPNTRSIVSWVPYGPEGGCVGGWWSFTALLDNCIQCEAQSG